MKQVILSMIKCRLFAREGDLLRLSLDRDRNRSDMTWDSVTQSSALNIFEPVPDVHKLSQARYF
jgi:hypothetical protein